MKFNSDPGVKKMALYHFFYITRTANFGQYKPIPAKMWRFSVGEFFSVWETLEICRGKLISQAK